MMRSCARESREEDIPTEIPPMAGILTITHTPTTGRRDAGSVQLYQQQKLQGSAKSS